VEQGVFREGLDPVDIHASISALTLFNASNRHTFGLIFKDKARRRRALQYRRASITDMVVRFVREVMPFRHNSFPGYARPV